MSSRHIPQPIVDIQNLSFAFGEGELKKRILHDVSLRILPGEIVILSGPSGSGKTTLLTLISGLRTLQEGSARVLGRELRGATASALMGLRRRIGFIFQAHNLLGYLTALQNVETIFHLQPEVSGAEARRRSVETLTTLGLDERLHYHPARLSGGQRQRVAIARALAATPELILADEPTAALDSHSGRTVVKLLEELARSRGIPILMVTHDTRILDTADRVVEMEDGRIKA
jgi:putative ABC transport system ATP-binding protein